MYESYNYNKNIPLKPYISEAMKHKAHTDKKHSDSLNCIINCAEFSLSLFVTQKPSNKKSNIFHFQKGNNFSLLFFYDIPSNKVIDEMQTKNEEQKLLNNTQKIKTENEIFDKYEQYKKNKMLLFKYIKFPLININQENNENKLSTIIILDKGENDIISNFSTNSSFLDHQTCSISLEIKNMNNCDYLFSLNDIKDCQEITIKLNGKVHEQALFNKEIICYISPELIEDSIRQRMQKFDNYENVEDLLGKFFFTKLKDTNANNIGILFSLKKKSEKSNLKYDKEYIKSDRYLINKIFLFIDMWLNDNNKNHPNNKSSTNTSSYMIFNNKLDEKYCINNNFYYYLNPFDYNYPNYYYNNEYQNNNNYYNNYKEIKESNPDMIYNGVNDINKIYIKNRKDLFDDNISNSLSNKYNDNNYSVFDAYFKPDYDNYSNYCDKDYELNNLLNEIEKMGDAYQEPEVFFDSKSDILICREKQNKSNMDLTSNSCSNYTLSENSIIKNIYIKRTLFIDMNEELLRKLFEKYEQDKCISNYSIVKDMLDINMNFETKNTKLIDFFDIFQNVNCLTLNVPFVTLKGKLFINCFSPSLSSMILVVKAKKNVRKQIRDKCKKFRGFRTEIYKVDNTKLLKIEFEEIKPVHKRELLYFKIMKIKKILQDAKLKNKDIMLKYSFFSVLWSVSNNSENKSSFLAYYSFDFKLIGILIIKLNYNNWMTPFSYKLDNYHDYITEYENNVKDVKKRFENLSINKDDNKYEKYFKHDYNNWIKSNKNNY